MNRHLPAALAAAIVAVSAAAQPLQWTPLGGPRASNFNHVAVTGTGVPVAVSDVEVHRYIGERWREVTSTFTGSFHDIAAGPDGVSWAGTGGVFRISGGAWDWFPVRTLNEGIPLSVLRVAVGPDGTVYLRGFGIGSDGNPFDAGYRSLDEGQTWPEMGAAPNAMAFVGTAAYAATDGGVARSANRGASWAPSGLDGEVVVAIAATGTRLVAATASALWTSDDGTAWMQSAVLSGVTTLAATPDGAVWAVAPGGLYRSVDGGQTWPATPAAFAGEPVRDVAAADGRLAVVVGHTPYLSHDGGATWAAIVDGIGLQLGSVLAAGGAVLAAGADQSGLSRSHDGGATWTTWNEGLADPLVFRRLLVDPAAGWAAVRTFRAAYRTTPPGAGEAAAPWTPVVLPTGRPPETFEGDAAGRLYGLDSDPDTFEGRVFRSDDGGLSWAPLFFQDGFNVSHVVPAGDLLAIVAVDGNGFGTRRLFVSSDDGSTFVERAHPVPGAFDAARLFADEAARLYLGDATNRLRRSTDGGVTWARLGPTGPANIRALSVVTLPGQLCTGTSQGVYCSSDDGATFDAASAGLPTDPDEGTASVFALVVNEGRPVVLVEDGLFGTSGAVSANPAATGGPVLSVAMPNPTSGPVALTLTLSSAGPVTAAVFDALGRRVAVLHDGPLPAGTHRLAVDAAALAPGVYVVRAVAGGDALARRVVVTH